MNGGARKEVTDLLEAAGRIASQDEVLFGVTHAALGTFERLYYAEEQSARDSLASVLEPALRGWWETIR